MSSTSDFPTPSSSPPTHSGTSQSSNLYLVTFLATLFLLLFVSCAIVLRSYILRRRYQRRLDDAMAAGMVLTPRVQGSKRKRFGAKPKITDTWLVPGGEKWDSIMPLCAQSVFVKRKYRDGQGPRAAGFNDHAITILPDTSDSPISQASAPPESSHPTLSHRIHKIIDRARFFRSPAPAANVQPPVPTADTPVVSTGTYKVRVEMLQISVLVAMPSPSHTMRKNARLDRIHAPPSSDPNSITYHDETDVDDDDDDEDSTVLPELVFGVARVNYPKPPTKGIDEIVLPPVVDVAL